MEEAACAVLPIASKGLPCCLFFIRIKRMRISMHIGRYNNDGLYVSL